jgi:glycosyltransferase involved in cell wall biosynthesis
MRTLVIASDYPWPQNSGARIRLVTTLMGLSGCGPTDLFCMVPTVNTRFDPPDSSVGLDRVAHVAYDDRTLTPAQLVASLPWPSMPMDLPWLQRSKGKAGLDAFVTGRYDLIWCVGVRAWVLAGEPSLAPMVIDLFDLEDQKILARLSIPEPPRSTLAGRARAFGARAYSHEQARRWGRMHRRVASRARTIVVCSDLDASRARAVGVPRVTVVPNGYDRVEEPLGRLGVGTPPTVLFQGFLRYPPNAQAARFLVEEIGPRLRRHLPDVRLRLVGHGTPELAALDHPPSVSMVGRVPDIDTELARADLVVVPLLVGSGTRVKILEAFAHRIPVVSTTIGAEGLGARDGEHLLVADDPAGFADACAQLLTDHDLRARIVDRAHRLFIERYQRDRVVDEVRRVAEAAGAR